jgi:hypothetical protein
MQYNKDLVNSYKWSVSERIFIAKAILISIDWMDWTSIIAAFDWYRFDGTAYQ